MRWRIPAKTFLVGEYAATAGGAAIVLTTEPYFELHAHLAENCSKSENVSEANCPAVSTTSAIPMVSRSHEQRERIHPRSPAGLFAQQYLPHIDFTWHDPYQGVGGLGASSAQFLGVFLTALQQSSVQYSQLLQPLDASTLLEAYHHVAWSGEGTKPSGYDVLAQSQTGCVYIHLQKNQLTSFDWAFADLDFLLVHSGQKYPTHEHLKNITLPYQDSSRLSSLAEQAHIAFEESNGSRLIDTVNAYQQALETLDLSTAHSKAALKTFRNHPDILAAKGCGALGADILLLILPKQAIETVKNELIDDNWTVLSSGENLYQKNALISLQSSANLLIFDTWGR